MEDKLFSMVQKAYLVFALAINGNNRNNSVSISPIYTLCCSDSLLSLIFTFKKRLDVTNAYNSLASTVTYEMCSVTIRVAVARFVLK